MNFLLKRLKINKIIWSVKNNKREEIIICNNKIR